MARISTYPLDTHLVGSDYWIGSDADSNYATKNFTIDSVAEYMNRVATQQQALRFKYTNTIPRTDGCFFGADGATSAPTVAYNTITGFTLSKFELTNLGIDISSFYANPLGGSEVLITQCDDVSRWAVFSWVFYPDSRSDCPGCRQYSRLTEDSVRSWEMIWCTG